LRRTTVIIAVFVLAAVATVRYMLARTETRTGDAVGEGIREVDP
jgi:hypothetical protein